MADIAFVCITAGEYDALKNIARVAANYRKEKEIPDRKLLFKLAGEYSLAKFPKVILNRELTDFVIKDFTE